jgi:hypothetical protein
MWLGVGIASGVWMTRDERATMRRDLDLYREIRSEDLKLPSQLREQLALEKKARASDKATCEQSIKDADVVLRECFAALGRKNSEGAK